MWAVAIVGHFYFLRGNPVGVAELPPPQYDGDQISVWHAIPYGLQFLHLSGATTILSFRSIVRATSSCWIGRLFYAEKQ